MKIVYMGTPEFARRPLEHLCENSGHEVLAVVTGQDKPSGRGLKLTPTPVKEAALKFALPIFTPESLKDPHFLEQMKKAKADIFVIVAFRILPEPLFTIPPYGSINLHGSLLPKYRGAAPINWALINGETETGLTIFFLDKKVDTGKIIFRQKISIPPEETFDELHRRMSKLAGPVIEKSLDLIESGKAVAEIQDNALATPAPKFSPEACQIDWGFPADNVVNFIRGLSSTPGAFSGFHGKKIKLLRATQCNISILETYEPGQIIMEKNRLIVAVAGGFVEILEILPEGKSKMTGSEFVRGYRPDNREMMSTREREK